MTCAELGDNGVECNVFDAYTLPLDSDRILEVARASGGTILTIEDNGLGGVHAELAEAAATHGDVRVVGLTVNRIPKSAKTADEVFEVTGRNHFLDIALELERIALNEPYFIDRNLYPNVDFYSGIIYQAMGFPVEMFPVLFAIPRTAGWLAQWEELVLDPEQKIVRPRQVYVGPGEREFVAGSGPHP